MKVRAYKIAMNPKYDENQGGLASMVCKFFEKKTGLGATATSKAVI